MTARSHLAEIESVSHTDHSWPHHVWTRCSWTRRTWLARNTIVALTAPSGIRFIDSHLVAHAGAKAVLSPPDGAASSIMTDVAQTNHAAVDADVVQLAVEAATRAGAQYVDARMTNTLFHRYRIGDSFPWEWERVGIGVRALVNGYWGFAGRPSGAVTDVEDLARRAVAQATVNARGAAPRAVELGKITPATGTWTTPVRIDPFTVPVEEKLAFMPYWAEVAKRMIDALDPDTDPNQTGANPLSIGLDPLASYLDFARQDCVVATSEGSHFAQTLYESGGRIVSKFIGNSGVQIEVQGIASAGAGWELILDAKIPEQIMTTWGTQIQELKELGRTIQAAAVGRYTIVCDGATMAAILESTLGMATQLDRALGYEANATGTSFITDPLAMLGTFQVASPMVTLTANRSAPRQLATVKWDAEGVVPDEMHLVKNGIVTDFQTTREQAAWLAPYYAKRNRPLRSNGCAAAEDALRIPMQHAPNLSLEPTTENVSLTDLIANVSDGIYIERGKILQMDAQARNGLLLSPYMRKIKNGRLGPLLTGGALQFNTLDLWKNVIAIGGVSTQAVVPFSQYPFGGRQGAVQELPVKGQPAQMFSHSVEAVAATITNQAIINPMRKA